MGYIQDKYGAAPPTAPATTTTRTTPYVSVKDRKTAREIEIQTELLSIPESTKTLLGTLQNAGKDFLDVSTGLARLGYGGMKALVSLPLNTTKATGQFVQGDREGAFKTLESEIKAAKTIGFVTGETVKSIPEAVSNAISIARHPIDSGRVVIEGVQMLHEIPYKDQKALFQRAQEKLDALPDHKRFPASLAVANMQDYMAELSHPLEFGYEHPVYMALDAYSVLQPAVKSTGVPARVAKIQKVQQARNVVREQLGRMFAPNGGLRYQLTSKGIDPTYADDAHTLVTDIADARYGVMEDTLQKFNKQSAVTTAKRKVGKYVADVRGLETKQRVGFNLTKAEQVEFFDTVDSLRRSTKLPISKNPKIQSALDWWLEDSKVLAASAGVPLDKVIQNYMHHVFPEKLQSSATNLGSKIQTASRGYLKQSADVTGYLHDPIASIATIKSRVAVDNIKDAFISKTTRTYGKTLKQLRKETGLLDKSVFSEAAVLEAAGYGVYTPKGKLRFFPIEVEQAGALGADVRKLVGVSKKVEKHYLPEPIAKNLESFDGGRDSMFEKWVARPLDLFHREWKPLATSTRLRYHTRNIVGNIWNASWIGGAKPTSYTNALKAQLDHYLEIDSPAARFYQQAIDDKIVGRGFFGADVRDLYRMSDDIDKVRNIGELRSNRSLLSRTPVIKDYMRATQNVGEALENNARLALYDHAVNKLGMSPFDSRNYVNKHLFDYLTGLGDTDRVIKRFIPFWSWQRFNIPLQAEFTVVQRAKSLAQAHIGSYITEENQRNDPTYEYLPEYRQKRGAIRVGTDEDGNAIYIQTRGVIPYSDLAGFLYALGGSDVSDVVSATPAITVPLQLLQNVDNFRDKPIERVDGEVRMFFGVPVKGKVAFALSNIPFLTEIDKVVGGSYQLGAKPKLIQRLNQAINPFALSFIDPISAKSYNDFVEGMEKSEQLGGVFSSGIMRQIALEYFRNPEDKAFQQNFHIATAAMIQQGYSPEDVTMAIISGERAAIKAKIRRSVQEQLDGTNFKPVVPKEFTAQLARTYDRKTGRKTVEKEIEKILSEEIKNAHDIYDALK